MITCSETCTCPIEFRKLHSAGNDFVCIDNLDGRFNPIIANGCFYDLVRRICRRGLGVGADGVILACEKGTGAGVDIVARFLEPDGSEAKLCGNGTACFTYWAIAEGLLTGPEVTILTGAGTATGRMLSKNSTNVRVCVPNPHQLEWDIPIEAAGRSWIVDYADTGVPHAVIYPENPLAAFDVPKYGKAIRNHPHFSPEGVNANFVEIVREGEINLRTFEFGVEAETLACGTGSAASAIITALKHRWAPDYLNGQRPVKVNVRSGACLKVWFEMGPKGTITDVCMETDVMPVYAGVMAGKFLFPDCTLKTEADN